MKVKAVLRTKRERDALKNREIYKITIGFYLENGKKIRSFVKEASDGKIIVEVTGYGLRENGIEAPDHIARTVQLSPGFHMTLDGAIIYPISSISNCDAVKKGIDNIANALKEMVEVINSLPRCSGLPEITMEIKED